MAVLSDRVIIAARIPLEKSVDTLEDRARDILAKLGYTEQTGGHGARASSACRITSSMCCGQTARPRDGAASATRTSPRSASGTGRARAISNRCALSGEPGFDDPPMAITNMRLVVMDIAGHLTQFSMVPPQREDARDANAPQPTMNWTLFFDAAGLDIGTFKPVPSTWVPNSYADERKAWEGPMPGRPDITLHADAASYRGQPAFFQIAGPWSRTLRQTQEVPQGRSVIRFLQFLIVFGLSIGTCVLARRNYVTGRGDRRGATRVALAWLVFYFAAWLLGARFWLEPLAEFSHFLGEFAAEELLDAAIIWLIYMALEPYVRRYSADILMSWSRLLSGRVRDPRVGRDILVGIVAGLTIAIVGCLVSLAPAQLGYPPVPPRNMNLSCLEHETGLSGSCACPTNALQNGMLTTLLFALVRMAVKRTWIATS